MPRDYVEETASGTSPKEFATRTNFIIDLEIGTVC